MPLTPEQLPQAWQKVVELVKNGPMNVPLWEALERCVPLAYGGGRFYVGMDVNDLRYGTVFRAERARAQVETAAERVLGERPALVIVEGTDAEAIARELEKEKARREAVARQTAQAQQRRDGGQVPTWESVGLQMQRLHATYPDKGLPWAMVAYMRDAFALLAPVEAARRAAGEDKREFDRGLAKILGSIANQVEAPVVWVTSEYLAFKAPSDSAPEQAAAE
jgi:hypothetical protein